MTEQKQGVIERQELTPTSFRSLPLSLSLSLCFFHAWFLSFSFRTLYQSALLLLFLPHPLSPFSSIHFLSVKPQYFLPPPALSFHFITASFSSFHPSVSRLSLTHPFTPLLLIFPSFPNGFSPPRSLSLFLRDPVSFPFFLNVLLSMLLDFISQLHRFPPY